MDSPRAFDLLNPEANGPVVVSVPHAGRDYQGAWTARLRPTPEQLIALEDRHADALAASLTSAPVLIARMPRTYLDLNRHEAEIDPGLVDGAVASRLILSPKVRNGLGLIPRRLAGLGELWRGRLSLADVESRIATVHRPYHQQLAALLRRALDRHGVAVLLDLHSMPSLPDRAGSAPAPIVIGNRFGQSAAPWVTARIVSLCTRYGLNWRENTPYAGGHVVERHGAPAREIHAVQLEVDRSLYLQADMRTPSPTGVARIQSFVEALAAELAAGASDAALPLAAE
jgi:N-formylglutamate amidohydrolase